MGRLNYCMQTTVISTKHFVKHVRHLSHVMWKPTFCIYEKKGSDHFGVTVNLLSTFVFATGIVQFLYFLNPKFPASSHLHGYDQLRGHREADQHLCFRYRDRTIPLLLSPKFPASSHLLCLYSLVCAGPGWKPHCWFSRTMAHSGLVDIKHRIMFCCCFEVEIMSLQRLD